MDVAGHNVANVGTDGYTRQRIEQSSITSPAQGWAGSTGVQAGQGVSVDRIARLGSALLDASVRTTASTAGYLAQRSAAFGRIESTLREPGSDGLSARLTAFWSAWQDVANQPGDPGATSALLSTAGQLATTLSSGRAALETQWADTATDTRGMVSSLNDAATQVAALNKQIRSAVAQGGSPNELLDARARLTESASFLAGATTRAEADGTVTVYLGGNALVRGDSARAVAVVGATIMDQSASSPPRLEWADQPGHAGRPRGRHDRGCALSPRPDAAGRHIRRHRRGRSLLRRPRPVHRLVRQRRAPQRTDPHRRHRPRLLPPRPHAAGGPGALIVPTGADGIATAAVGSGALDSSTADAIAQTLPRSRLARRPVGSLRHGDGQRVAGRDTAVRSGRRRRRQRQAGAGRRRVREPRRGERGAHRGPARLPGGRARPQRHRRSPRHPHQPHRKRRTLTMIRVTDQSMSLAAQRALGDRQSRLASAQQTATSGARISRPSDDPVGTGEALRVRAEPAAHDQFHRNIADGTGWLRTIDSALDSAGGALRQVRDAVVQAGNGSLTQDARDALASVVEGLRADLLGSANTRYLGRNVFAEPPTPRPPSPTAGRRPSTAPPGA